MLTVDEALDRILQEVTPPPPVAVALHDALGLVLAVNVVSDTDSPPFDKSMMDGYAIRAADVGDTGTTLQVIEEVTAGRVAEQTVGPGQATRIMTGAPIPDGADAVVAVEETRASDAPDRVTIQCESPRPGTNIIPRGMAMKAGETVLEAGCVLRAPQLGALAELGCDRVTVYRPPLLAVLATGDELVPLGADIGPGQIRNSNESMLLSQAAQFGCWKFPLGIARDDEAQLTKKVTAGLVCDILCLSGGVSAGKLDLVPKVLQATGVREVFHKVQIKPGKPVWFGVLDADRAPDGRPHYIFGLPGNPVSSMVCCELFVQTAVRRLRGVEPARAQPLTAELACEHRHRDERPTFFPSRLAWDGRKAVVTPLDWKGSADLRSTVDANAMTLFPAGERSYAAGEQVSVYPWSGSRIL
jgi:molybdopterin molybdotransferase